MASQEKISVTTTTTYSSSPKGGGSASGSPRGPGQCLCSPTTHQGSFRCKYHRSSSGAGWFKRSNSMPPQPRNAPPVSPKPVESST
ncbi:hypothetical protein AgCh_027037 [Apium graveolens]